ncbi:MAG TPA: DNA-3-methyladenine glycosylase I [Drouetiella sp.]
MKESKPAGLKSRKSAESKSRQSDESKSRESAELKSRNSAELKSPKSAGPKSRQSDESKSRQSDESNSRKSVPKTGASKASVKSGEKEREIPGKITATKLADYLEIMTIAAFQAGVSWAMIQNKWKNFQAAFAKFDPETVANFGQKDIDRLMQDAGIMRTEKKIRGTIDNARAMLEMEKQHGSFQNYLRSFKSYEALSADIQKRFKYIGEMSVYYFLFRVGENVPPFEPWIVTIPGDHPRMREMVEKYGQ